MTKTKKSSDDVIEEKLEELKEDQELFLSGMGLTKFLSIVKGRVKT